MNFRYIMPLGAFLLLFSPFLQAAPPEDLCRAAFINRVDKVKAFLKRGDDPNACHEHVPPLLHAVMKGGSTITRLLLEAGADPLKCTTNSGTTLIQRARKGRANKELSKAKRKSYAAIVNLLRPYFEPQRTGKKIVPPISKAPAQLVPTPTKTKSTGFEQAGSYHGRRRRGNFSQARHGKKMQIEGAQSCSDFGNRCGSSILRRQDKSLETRRPLTAGNGRGGTELTTEKTLASGFACRSAARKRKRESNSVSVTQFQTPGVEGQEEDAPRKKRLKYSGTLLLDEIIKQYHLAVSRDDQTKIKEHSRKVREIVKAQERKDCLLGSKGEKLLLSACKANDFYMARLLLKIGVSHKYDEELDKFPLHVAAEKGSRSVVSVFANAHEIGRNNIQFDALDQDGNTPLGLAVAAGHKNVVIDLLKKGANVFHRNKKNTSIEDLALADDVRELVGEHLNDASMDVDLEEALAEADPPPTTQERLLRILRSDDLEKYKTFCRDLSVEEKQVMREELVQKVIESDACNILSYLLEGCGMNVNSVCSNQHNLVQAACVHGAQKILCSLISRGADLLIQTPFGETVSDLIDSGPGVDPATSVVLYLAVEKQKNNVAKEEKIRSLHANLLGFLAEDDVENFTSIHDEFGKEKLLTVLEETSLLHAALKANAPQIAVFCISNGENDLNVRDRFYNTPLHIACIKGMDEVVSLLLDQDGVSTLLKNKQGLTPLKGIETHTLEVTVYEQLRTRTEREKLAAEPSLCVVCLDEDEVKCMAAVPCGHKCCCSNCSQALKKCPLCRAKVTNWIRVYG